MRKSRIATALVATFAAGFCVGAAPYGFVMMADESIEFHRILAPWESEGCLPGFGEVDGKCFRLASAPCVTDMECELVDATDEAVKASGCYRFEDGSVLCERPKLAGWRDVHDKDECQTDAECAAKFGPIHCEREGY